MTRQDSRAIDYTCECPLDPGEERSTYIVTGHDGSETLCAYCADCAQLAALDWNGETAAIRLKADADADYDRGRRDFYAGLQPLSDGDDYRRGWSAACHVEGDL